MSCSFPYLGITLRLSLPALPGHNAVKDLHDIEHVYKSGIVCGICLAAIISNHIAFLLFNPQLGPDFQEMMNYLFGLLNQKFGCQPSQKGHPR